MKNPYIETEESKGGSSEEIKGGDSLGAVKFDATSLLDRLYTYFNPEKQKEAFVHSKKVAVLIGN